MCFYYFICRANNYTDSNRHHNPSPVHIDIIGWYDIENTALQCSRMFKNKKLKRQKAKDPRNNIKTFTWRKNLWFPLMLLYALTDFAYLYNSSFSEGPEARNREGVDPPPPRLKNASLFSQNKKKMFRMFWNKRICKNILWTFWNGIR